MKYRPRGYSITELKTGRNVDAVCTSELQILYLMSPGRKSGWGMGGGGTAKLICLLIYYRELIKLVSSVVRGVLETRDRCLSRGIYTISPNPYFTRATLIAAAVMDSRESARCRPLVLD